MFFSANKFHISFYCDYVEFDSVLIGSFYTPDNYKLIHVLITCFDLIPDFDDLH